MDDSQKEIERQDQISRYENALNLAYYEGQIAWPIKVLFVGLNIGIGTIIQNKVDDPLHFDWVLFYMSATGVLMNLYWWGTFNRNNRYYNFRMAQAREAEPQHWQLVKKRGYDLSHGDKIIIEIGEGGKDPRHSIHQLSKFERMASNKWAIQVAIWVFAGTFAILFLLQIRCIFQHFFCT